MELFVVYLNDPERDPLQAAADSLPLTLAGTTTALNPSN